MTIASQLTALGHPQRLALFRLLMRRYPDRVSAGDLARALDLKPSTLSSYLATLSQDGLISSERRGRSLMYGVNIAHVRQMFGYLLNDCCRGRGDLCAPSMPVGTAAPINVVFVCVGNSARSIFAESILRRVGGATFAAYSAGTQPDEAPNAGALALLRAQGHDTDGLHAKHISTFQGADAPVMDYVITVCDRAANADGPAWPGQPVYGHFSTPDPVAVAGDAAARRRAFCRAYEMLHHRITQFTTRIDGTLSRLDRQTIIDDIALTGGIT